MRGYAWEVWGTYLENAVERFVSGCLAGRWGYAVCACAVLEPCLEALKLMKTNQKHIMVLQGTTLHRCLRLPFKGLTEQYRGRNKSLSILGHNFEPWSWKGTRIAGNDSIKLLGAP